MQYRIQDWSTIKQKIEEPLKTVTAEQRFEGSFIHVIRVPFKHEVEEPLNDEIEDH